jgi:hypothetical protein
MHFSILFILPLLTQAANIPFPEAASYKSLMKRSYGDRVAIYRRASPSARVQFWTDKIEAYQNSNANTITFRQSQVLRKALELVKSDNNINKTEYSQLKDDAINAFGFEEGKTLFSSPGGEGDGENNSSVESLVKRDSFTGCTCSTDNDLCGFWKTCIQYDNTPNEVCNPFHNEPGASCGFLGQFRCDGGCV